MGTPAYISPEQVRGDVDRTDEQSDVFGLGAILCEILSGDPPYVGQNVTEVEQRAKNVDLTDAFHRLDQCRADHALVSLTKRCLDPAPANRPRHAGVLAEELAAYLRSVQDRLRQTELENIEVRAKATHERRLRWMTVGLAAMVLLFGACGAGVWFWVQQDRQNQFAETNKRLQAELLKEKEIKAEDVVSFYAGSSIPSDQILPRLEQMVDTSFGDSPFVEAMFRQTMSSTYLSRGEYNLARSNAEKAVELLTTAAGPDRPVTLAAKKHLRQVQESLYSRPSDPTARTETLTPVTADSGEPVLFGSSYEQAVLADSPAGYWQLNEAAGAELARDASTSANHLRYNGTSVTKHGATVFQSEGPSTTDFAQGPMFTFPRSTFSIEFWLNTTATNNSTILSYATFRGDDNEVAIDNESANGLRVYIGGSGRRSSVYIDDGEWHHIVVTWQSWDGTLELYKDGSLAFREFHSQGKSLFNQGSLVFGQDQDEPGGGFEAVGSYQGSLAEVAIYDTVLSANRIAAHYVSAKTLGGVPLQMTAADYPKDDGPDNRLIQTIEAGNSTQECDFQTIGRPSGQDYADRSRELVTLTAIGALYHSSGPTDVLRDGVSQSRRDSSGESLFFRDDIANGCLLMDLGRKVPVTKINTYTWHAYANGFDPDGRAAQRYVLYGSNAATPPATERDFWNNDEWKVIARVDTDIHFAVLPDSDTRPGQLAVSITGRDEIVADVRYLLWRITPSRRQPLLGEIDVYVRPDSTDPD